jgi:ubiquitin carboxyl-terminal hydrolase 8
MNDDDRAGLRWLVPFFKPTEPDQLVFVVEKQWYDSLVHYLTFPGSPDPGPMTLNSLMSGDHFLPDLQRGIDFEVMAVRPFHVYASRLKGFTVCKRRLVRDPKTGESTIILNPDVASSPAREADPPDDREKGTALALTFVLSASPFPRPVGLRNLGNTCFFSAAVQCLSRVAPLTAFLLSSSFDDQLNRRNPRGSGGQIARAYRAFLEDMCSGDSHARSLSHLRSAVTSQWRRFANSHQHDSQELLCYLLDGLHEDLNQSTAARGRIRPAAKPSAAMDSWELYLAKNASPIQELFVGYLFNSLECPACRNCQCVRDPFTFLSLPIPARTGRTIKLTDCLHAFGKVETLDRNNTWKCSSCGKKVRATMRMGIGQCAPILIIHLKRFAGTRSKIDTDVEYPDRLDMATFIQSGGNSCYALIGAVLHYGGLGGGHFVAAARDAPSGYWYMFDDSRATKIGVSGAHSNKAYILFYQKVP